MRGLLHLKEAGEFTHCLFMDDDASCEIESIRRCYHLLSLARTTNFAVSGSMLMEVEPYRLHEKGGCFRLGWRSLKSDLDMRGIAELLEAETENENVDYGVWWFFAFRIADVHYFAFPFFVRGDDVQFGLQNKFSITTLNGIGCWAEDFRYKEGPLARYLGARATFLLNLAFEESGWLQMIRLYSTWFLTSLLSYNYASAKAVRMAMSNLLSGPRFWIDNIDIADIRAKIASFASSENMVTITRSDYELDMPGSDYSRSGQLFRVISLNGFLLPTFMLRNRVVLQSKAFRGIFRQIFRYRKILYEYQAAGIGYVAKHDKKIFFIQLAQFGWLLTILSIRHVTLKRKYKEAIVEMTRTYLKITK